MKEHWKGVDSYFCARPYWILICRSFPFRRKIYGRRLFKWITQRDLLTFVLIKLLVFTPLFNAQKTHVLNYFALEMAAIVVARRRHHREQRARGRREGIFSYILIYLECQKNTLSEHNFMFAKPCYFNLLQEIKDDLEPSTRSHAIPDLSKLLETLHFLASGSFQRTVASLFLHSLFATTLFCAALGALALVDM